MKCSSISTFTKPELDLNRITFESVERAFNEAMADPKIQKIRFYNQLRRATQIFPYHQERINP